MPVGLPGDQPSVLPPVARLAVLIWPRRYSRAASSWRSLNSLAALPFADGGSIVSRLRWCSARSRRSFGVSLITLSGITPHSSSSLPPVLDLFRFLPLGRQNVAVVSLISAFFASPVLGSTTSKS